MLEPFADSIWTITQPFRFVGVPCGARMTVVRLSSGALWVHSPLGMSAELAREIDRLGPVEYIIAPSRLHYLCVNEFRERHPEAAIFGSPNLVKRGRGIQFTGTLQALPQPQWAAEIDQDMVPYNRLMDEVVFLHRSCRTLIVADMLASAHADSSWQWRLLGRLGGIYETPGPLIDMKVSLWNRVAARSAVERILTWDFDRIILSHGRVIRAHGKEVFRRAYAFLTGA